MQKNGEIMENIFREYKTKVEFEKRSRLDFPPHLHDDVEIVYVIRGNGEAFCAGKKYSIEPGMFFVAFPNQVHYYSGCSEGEYIILIAKPSFVPSLSQTLRENEPKSPIYLPKSADLSDLLKDGLQEKEEHGDSRVLDAYLVLFFLKLLRETELDKCTIQRDIASSLLQYCTAHYKEDITVSSAAKALNISRSSVSHFFVSRIGMNFCEYINTLRLAQAVKLMEDNSLNITEIAFLSGFSTIRTFNRAFLKQYGIPPTRYRKRPK